MKSDNPILFVDKALTATELRRLETELQAFAEAGAGAALIVVESIELAEADSLARLADLLEHPPTGLAVAVLLAGRIGRELGSRLLALELPAFVTPRTEIETAGGRRTITGTELELTGLATLVRTPRHAAERVPAFYRQKTPHCPL